jgi:anhydro-N-acetylmuramic acid kinase
MNCLFPKKEQYYAIGLMSGTSMDGVNAALISIIPHHEKLDIRLIDSINIPYKKELKKKIIRSSYTITKEICDLNFLLGDVFSDAVLSLVKKSKFDLNNLDFIGSHGQAIFHIKSNRKQSSTLQIGEPSIIAERTNTLVVSDFRTRDIAAGGTGAPLIPVVDYILFHDQGLSQIMLNIGGTANITYLPPDKNEIFGFDTGPGNSLIDAAFRVFNYKKLKYDKDGSVSKKGTIDKKFLDYMQKDDYYKKNPPKMVAFEYRDKLIIKLKKKFSHIKFENFIATLVELTASSISDAIKRFVIPFDSNVKKVIASGGGVYNKTLINRLRYYLKKTCGIDNLIIDDKYGDAKEAVGFAILAYLTLTNQPGNIPKVTGARGYRILGKITPK